MDNIQFMELFHKLDIKQSSYERAELPHYFQGYGLAMVL
jgi:hypothetical protein